MERNDYEPVSCDYHDQLEAAAVKRREVDLEFEMNGVRTHQHGKIDDVFTREGAEFVQLAADDGSVVEIRLDHIFGFREI